MSQMNLSDEVRKLHRSYLHLVDRTSPEGDIYARGYALTKWGIVGIYTQLGSKSSSDDYTRFFFVHADKEYTRSVNRYFSERYLLTMAGRFAREIAEANG